MDEMHYVRGKPENFPGGRKLSTVLTPYLRVQERTSASAIIRYSNNSRAPAQSSIIWQEKNKTSLVTQLQD